VHNVRSEDFPLDTEEDERPDDTRVTTRLIFKITLNEDVERCRLYSLVFMKFVVYNCLIFYAIFSTKLYMEDFGYDA